jgi:hypothetical protein
MWPESIPPIIKMNIPTVSHRKDRLISWPRWGWLSIGLLLILTLIFMERVIIPSQGQILRGGDVNGMFYPWMTFVRESVSEHQLPLWDPHQSGGYPFLANPQVGFFYPPAWLMILLPLNLGISCYVMLHLWIAGIGMLLFVRRMGGSWLGATLAAITFSFSGFVAGHITLLATNVWVPWILLATEWSTTRQDWGSGVLSGIPFALAILAGHIASLVYVGIIWLAFALYLGFMHQHWAVLIRQLAISGLCGILLSTVQLIPLAEFSSLSTRTGGTLGEFGSLWSLPPNYLITLAMPYYYGEPTQIGYWGPPDFEELTFSIGLLPLLCIPLALRKPTRLIWLYVGLGVFGLLTALGVYSFLYPLLYNLLPPFRLARGPARAAFLFVFAGSAFLGEALSVWERQPLQSRVPILKSTMTVMLSSIVAAGTLGLVASGIVFTINHPSEVGGRAWHQSGDWLWAIILSLLGGILLWRYLTADKPAQKRRLSVGLIVLVVIDLWSFGFNLLQLTSMSPAQLWIQAKQVIGDTPQRVVPWAVGVNNQLDSILVDLNSALGNNPLTIQSYRDFTATLDDPRTTVLDILGVEYVLSPGPLDSAYTEGERPVQLVSSTDAVWIYRRARVMPIARLAYQIEVIADPAQARARINAPGFEPASTVILDAQPSCQVDVMPDTPGSAEIVERSPGYWKIDTESTVPSLLVLSETAYPGWKVTIDGEQAESLTAYTAIRAVCVPAGKHQIEWIFDPITYKIGAGITILALITCGLAGLKVWQMNRTLSAIPPSHSGEDAVNE